MNDIKIDILNLEKLISMLDKDTVEINNSLMNINNTLKQLDSSKWSSPEKDKIDSEFMVYMNESVAKAEIELKAPLNNLRKALEKYKNLNNKIEKATENLAGSTNSVG